jgi:hypothetical protein
MSGEKPSVTELYAQWLKARGPVLEHLENRDDNNPAMEPAHAAEEDAIAGMIVTLRKTNTRSCARSKCCATSSLSKGPAGSTS